MWGDEENAINNIKTYVRSKVGTLGLNAPASKSVGSGGSGLGSNKGVKLIATAFDRSEVNKLTGQAIGDSKKVKRISFEGKTDVPLTIKDDSGNDVPYTIEHLVKEGNGQWMAKINIKTGDNQFSEEIVPLQKNIQEGKAGVAQAVSSLIGANTTDLDSIYNSLTKSEGSKTTVSSSNKNQGLSIMEIAAQKAAEAKKKK
jgi:hypothetical protein